MNEDDLLDIKDVNIYIYSLVNGRNEIWNWLHELNDE